MSNKQTTAMQELIEYSNNQIVICENEVLNSRFLIMHNKEAIRNYWESKLDSYKELNCKATELLTKEREQINDAVSNALKLMCPTKDNLPNI